MKDLVSCFSEHAVRISDVACSGGANAADAAGAVGGGGRGAAVSAVTSVYRSQLSASGKDLLIDVTWSRASDGPALSVTVHEVTAASCHRAGAAPRHLHKKKGSGTFTAGSCVVGVFWDYTAARYGGARPEPVSGFYVAVVADAEFVLLLGDMSKGYIERLHSGVPISGSRMARRRERFVGCGCWSTRARFSDSGAEHEIGVGLDGGDAEAWVSVDGRKVVQLRRLRWNFRGSHTLFLDGGAPVDMTWDLHGWLFHAGGELPHASSSCAVFTFQARGASETRLWTDDDDDYADSDDHEKPPAPAQASGRRQKTGDGGASGQGFCLLIQGFRGFSKST
ncbi:uncharacterized protein LOC133887792 [Phragmites australis]|uniref:uncharacterized protein LOC133887792 n=1 Tax=Phragmites australis TaxID=29695 RepID=UPI002D78C76D|nr:uncharacterized protein LOC133887792 [Phragmites australis]